MDENITKNVGNLFRLEKLKKETNDVAIKGVRNLFTQKKKGNKAVKDRIIRDIKNLFEDEGEDYYQSVSVGNFWSNNYIGYESKGDRKILSVKNYMNKSRPYLKYIIITLKKIDS